MEIQNALETFMSGGDRWKGSIYGRICTTESINSRPAYLSDNPQRKTVFVFGADTVKSATEKEPFELLVHLGLLPEYIHLKACVQQASYWLVLLKHLEDDACRLPSKPSIVPATWDGLKDFILQYYPLAVNDVTEHWGTVISTPSKRLKSGRFQIHQGLGERFW
ncbi:hypothetical protein BSL78_05685 [Apostichopus japonicus]|uniref:Uncharacterized protein n=1 Tax=Stichopus japonicus TaxID=307972 RepID=A0A2G8LAZ3_STIJA|nr:hypothetical protein BSL78_05685 [Apostichopus japonicus]